MEKSFLIILILSILSILSMLMGCATQTFNIQPGKPYSSYDEYQVFFFEGIGQSKEIDVANVCGGINKVSKIEVEETLFEGIISMLTYHVYTPRNAKIFCSR